MINLHPEVVLDDLKRPKAVLIPMSEWEAVLDALEDLEDIRAYDEAKKAGAESVPFEQAMSEIDRGDLR